MLRTILLRNQALGGSLKKSLRSKATRCLSTELIRRKHCNRLVPSAQVVLAPQWTVPLRRYSSFPSHIKVNLPALSPTMESGSIISWEKKEGDKLNEGDLLCEIETDKATMGFETPEEGYLAKIIIQAGTKGVPVGKLLCIIVEKQADVAAFKEFKDDGSSDIVIGDHNEDENESDKVEKGSADAPPVVKKPEKKEAAAAPAESAPAAPKPAASKPAASKPAPKPAASGGQSDDQGRVYASPMAKRIAEIRNVRLGGQGSGLYGSLKSGDVADASSAHAAPSAPAPAPGASYVDIPLSGMRETIAKRLTAAKQSIPHYQLSTTVNIEKTLAMKKSVNETIANKAGVKVSMNDFIIKAVAAACKRVPSVNSHWMESYIRQFSNVDVSVAVATPTGLITPIVFHADSRGVLEISKAVKELAQKAKDGKLQPQEYQGGTVTVSNLGMFGITMFNAIINPPQSLILACGGLQEFVIPDKNEPVGFRTAKFVTFTASADHRVIDGAVGAQWMKAFKENMEDPANIIL